MSLTKYTTQNDELLKKLKTYYRIRREESAAAVAVAVATTEEAGSGSECETASDVSTMPPPPPTTLSPEHPLQKMLNIIDGKSVVSLRIVDWFVTNYAKENDTTIDPGQFRAASGGAAETSGEEQVGGGSSGGMRRFRVYDDYKLKLKAYSKKRFDPFCRWDRTRIPYTNGNYIETTIGQLNFFRWAIDNHIIDYIEQNYAVIEKDMNARNSTAKRKLRTIGGDGKTRKKREELSVSATKCIKKETVEIVVKFT